MKYILGNLIQVIFEAEGTPWLPARYTLHT